MGLGCIGQVRVGLQVQRGLLRPCTSGKAGEYEEGEATQQNTMGRSTHFIAWMGLVFDQFRRSLGGVEILSVLRLRITAERTLPDGLDECRALWLLAAWPDRARRQVQVWRLEVIPGTHSLQGNLAGTIVEVFFALRWTVFLGQLTQLLRLRALRHKIHDLRLTTLTQ
jgi:hypothetical protein